LSLNGGLGLSALSGQASVAGDKGQSMNGYGGRSQPPYRRREHI
jgi:hypothetical protein